MDKALFGNTLARYATCEPNHFLQLDGYNLPDGGNECTRPDADGDVIESRATVELMAGSSVKALIPHDANPFVAARELKKFERWLENEPRLLERAKPTVTQPDTNMSGGFKEFEGF